MTVFLCLRDNGAFMQDFLSRVRNQMLNVGVMRRHFIEILFDAVRIEVLIFESRKFRPDMAIEHKEARLLAVGYLDQKIQHRSPKSVIDSRCVNRLDQRPEKSVSHHANRGSPDVHLHQSEEDSVAGKKREYQPLARTPPAGNDDLYYLARYRASQSHGYGRAAVPSRGGGARPRRRTVGAVIKVVSTAMSSSMVNKEGWMMPACRPMLMTTSSIRPREFRSAPTLKVIRQGWPNRRAPIAAPTSFPPTAPMRISPN